MARQTASTTGRTPVHHCAILCMAVVCSLAVTCAGSSQGEITRDRAIEIARGQVSFEADRVEAQRADSQGRAVWRVTLRGRLPGQPAGLFETTIIEIDRRTGEVVSIARP